jgi:hypothetical protein
VDPDPIQIQGDDQKVKKKIYCEEKITPTAEMFWINNCNLGLRPPYRTSKLQEKPSVLKREHPAQKM